MMGLVLCAELPPALHLLGARRPLLLPAHRLLVPAARRRRAPRSRRSGRPRRGDVGLLIGIVLLWRADGHLRLHASSCSWPTAQMLPLGRTRRHHVLHLPRRDRQVGAVPAPRLAARRDGGPDAGLRAHPRRHDGRRPASTCSRARSGSSRSRPTCWRWSRWIGAFTALLAALLACVQTDIKRVLAYSTVSQLGYMMAAIGAGFAAARLPAPAHARRLQGAALPRRRRRHPRRRHQRHLRHGRASRGACRRRRSCSSSARCRSPASRSSPGSCPRKRCSAPSGRAASRCRS